MSLPMTSLVRRMLFMTNQHTLWPNQSVTFCAFLSSASCSRPLHIALKTKPKLLAPTTHAQLLKDFTCARSHGNLAAVPRHSSSMLLLNDVHCPNVSISREMSLVSCAKPCTSRHQARPLTEADKNKSYSLFCRPSTSPMLMFSRGARLIKIRRSKMNKHQYKRLMKRVGHIREYNRRRRKLAGLKVLHTHYDTILRKAHEFDPAAYVRNYIAKAKESQIRVQEKARQRRPWQEILAEVKQRLQ